MFFFTRVEGDGKCHSSRTGRLDSIEEDEKRKSKNAGVPDSYERGKMREVEGQPAADCDNLKLSR